MQELTQYDENPFDNDLFDLNYLIEQHRQWKAYKDQLKASIASAEEQADLNIARLQRVIHQRLIKMGTTSVKTDAGTAIRTEKTSFSVTDPAEFRDAIRRNPDEFIGLIQTRVTQASVAEYYEQTGALPPGITSVTEETLSIRKPSK